MQRPIEKFGWSKWGEELYIKDKCMIIYETSKIIINTAPQLFLSFEELQAIYETAKQLKEGK